MEKPHWSDAVIHNAVSGTAFRVLERYSLSGKNTGFVVVCESRRCYTHIRGTPWPLGLLPAGMSPEDRKAVVAWATARIERDWEAAFRCAVNGEPMPDPFKPEVSDEESA